MPELPEVETTCRAIRKFIVGARIDKIIIRQAKLRWPIPLNLHLLLKNQKIIKIERRAKYILIQTENGALIIHLGMSGRLSIYPINQPLLKHDHVDFILNNNTILRYNDPRRFGLILWTAKPLLNHPLLSKLGFEPFDKKLSAHILFNIASKKKIPIKQFIMDPKIIVGVGNIYATESLFYAKILPLRPANSLSLEEFETLLFHIKKIFKSAIKKGGTTLKDFIAPDGKLGYFVNELLVYGRANQNCKNCGTILKLITIQQRSTVYCDVCQQ
ncbi:MAG: mutM [Francisellaceae bacterium]|nr:mutM [Francisellaceae bacterium]